MLGGYKPGDVSEWHYMGGNKMFPSFKHTECSESANGESQICREMTM